MASNLIRFTWHLHYGSIPHSFAFPLSFVCCYKTVTLLLSGCYIGLLGALHCVYGYIVGRL